MAAFTTQEPQHAGHISNLCKWHKQGRTKVTRGGIWFKA